MSKGSARRPMAVSQEQFARNWERAFSNPEPPKPESAQQALDDLLGELQKQAVNHVFKTVAQWRERTQ